MRGIKFIPDNLEIRFIRKRVFFFVFSIVLVVLSLGVTVSRGLNFGIDFKGGILIEVRTNGTADIGAMREKLSGLDLGEVNLQEFGAPEDVLIRVRAQGGETSELREKNQQAAVDAVRRALGEDIEYRRTEVVGPKVSSALLKDGLWAVGLAMFAIMAYIWFRFEWQFGLGAVVALIHDVIATIGVFALMRFEFNLSTVAAVLTIAGYSINDTVVVYDRVRENLRKYKTTPLLETYDMAINKTLGRTLMTSVTTLLALLALYFLGGAVIRDFAFAMIWGVLVGTYSSVCLAVPLLLYVKVKRRSGDGGIEAKSTG